MKTLSAAHFAKKHLWRRFFFCLSLIFFACQPVLAQEQAITKRIETLAASGGIGLKKDQALLYSQNLESPYVPASIMKIATSLAAFEILGSDYRFETLFYLDQEENLYIKGLGDPFLISEEITLIANKLKQLGIERINTIILDAGGCNLASAMEINGNSLNPYDAGNSCLAVNFNTIKLRVLDNGPVISAEEQTPTLPLMSELATNLTPGAHRINVTAQVDHSLRYVGELFYAIFQKEGIFCFQGFQSGQTPLEASLIYQHRSSKSLSDVVESLLLYSNNFIANQLFLACGAVQYGWPASWGKGRLALIDYFERELGFTEQEFLLLEGSGLSRQNRITPRAMLNILERFKPHAGLLPKGKRGRYKSGTLTGVYSYAGYFTEGDELDPFVIILNQKRNRRDGVLYQLSRLYKAQLEQ